MRFRRSIALATPIVLLMALPADAIDCGTWTRLHPADKPAVVGGLIEDLVHGSAGREYHVNRGAVGRCLQRRSREIEYSFDDACASSRSGMQELNNIFKRYAWSCIR